ncbi:MAG TPA: hypothetical protein PLD20_17160 [Blastocatellia bacterium]|nr:hypothetical protein [Blastocatellia bacterium]HMV84342.1 hypothetical protein [Blastocatellia bacterium]HMX26962.1 hypothetical protein [Blastocatellia bacterium]HMY76379.1 hypothetical protein [Blastocatellia bacterium]HMZ19668.1 hypothetical protein [Blastocatellia bacterium]
MATSQLELIFTQAKPLAFEDKLRLLHWLIEELRPAAVSPSKSTGLVYGKYKNNGRRMSTEEDFKIAEWNPTNAELDGE